MELIPGNVIDHTTIAEGPQDLHSRVPYNLRAPSLSVLAMHFSDILFLSSKFTSYSAFLHARLHSNMKSGTKEYKHLSLQGWTRIRCTGFVLSLLAFISSETGLNFAYK